MKRRMNRRIECSAQAAGMASLCALPRRFSSVFSIVGTRLCVLLIPVFLLHACTTTQTRLTVFNEDLTRFDDRVNTFSQNLSKSKTRKKNLFNQIDDLLPSQPLITVTQQGTPARSPKSKTTQEPDPSSSTFSTTSKPAAPPPTNTDADALFQNAYSSYTKGNYSKAAEEFLFSYQYANREELKAKSLYWVGECHYRNQEWQKAIHCFTQLENHHENHSILPGALLKKGYAYLNSGNLQKGKDTLQQLIGKFPLSNEAPLARERLRELGAI